MTEDLPPFRGPLDDFLGGSVPDDHESDEENEVQLEKSEAEIQHSVGGETDPIPANFQPDEDDIYGSGDPVGEDQVTAAANGNGSTDWYWEGPSGNGGTEWDW